MIFHPGDDVIVTFEGVESPGEVIQHRNGFVLARIDIDPACDYGSVSARLDPRSTVMVREGNVRVRGAVG